MTVQILNCITIGDNILSNNAYYQQSEWNFCYIKHMIKDGKINKSCKFRIDFGICTSRRPRPTQGFRADDDDEPWESLVMCWTKFGLYLSVKVNRFYTVLRRCTGDIFLCAIGNDLCKDPKITKIFSLRFKKILYQWLQTLISFSKNRTRHIMWAIQSYLNVKSTAIYKL